MKKNHFNFIFTLLMCLLFLNACQKEETPNPPKVKEELVENDFSEKTMLVEVKEVAFDDGFWQALAFTKVTNNSFFKQKILKPIRVKNNIAKEYSPRLGDILVIKYVLSKGRKLLPNYVEHTPYPSYATLVDVNEVKIISRKNYDTNPVLPINPACTTKVKVVNFDCQVGELGNYAFKTHLTIPFDEYSESAWCTFFPWGLTSNEKYDLKEGETVFIDYYEAAFIFNPYDANCFPKNNNSDEMSKTIELKSVSKPK